MACGLPVLLLLAGDGGSGSGQALEYTVNDLKEIWRTPPIRPNQVQLDLVTDPCGASGCRLCLGELDDECLWRQDGW